MVLPLLLRRVSGSASIAPLYLVTTHRPPCGLATVDKVYTHLSPSARACVRKKKAYSDDMKKPKDGRVARGEQRRRAWQIAASALAAAKPSNESELTRDTYEAIVAFAIRRSAGIMGPPPGGVMS
jgi:hypothetical protein